MSKPTNGLSIERTDIESHLDVIKRWVKSGAVYSHLWYLGGSSLDLSLLSGDTKASKDDLHSLIVANFSMQDEPFERIYYPHMGESDIVPFNNIPYFILPINQYHLLKIPRGFFTESRRHQSIYETVEFNWNEYDDYEEGGKKLDGFRRIVNSYHSDVSRICKEMDYFHSPEVVEDSDVKLREVVHGTWRNDRYVWAHKRTFFARSRFFQFGTSN
ncbi:MAG: hypothetical protein WCV90_03705 [Candidatus Woesearchaeota archaeon]|jgi:hypothetical protein